MVFRWHAIRRAIKGWGLADPANTKSKGARPLTLWSQPIEGMTRGGREENAIIASRAACIICLSTADHLQKDCPEVKQGRESLESLLQVRRFSIVSMLSVVIPTVSSLPSIAFRPFWVFLKAARLATSSFSACT
jgi:hypothetical protein